MTKIDLISVVQMEMASGRMPKDLRGKYPIPYVSRLIHAWMTGICRSNYEVREETAIPYSFKVNDDDGHYITMSPKPINGSHGIVSIYDGPKAMSLAGIAMAQTLAVLNGGSYPSTANVMGNKIKFPCAPQSSHIDVLMVPNIYEMQDNDEIIAMGAEKYLLESLPDLMRRNDVRPEDKLNDNHVDVEQ